MSRIGKTPIIIPPNVKVTISDSNLVTVNGPKGNLTRQLDPDITISINDGIMLLERPTESKKHKSMHGLCRTLISNMVQGVSKGFSVKQEIVGVGYKVSNQQQILDLTIGYSHDIIIIIPDEVTLKTESVKGKNPAIILECCDNELLGLISAKIRSFRKPEPYKGKGIKYEGEVIRRKAGKTASAK